MPDPKRALHDRGGSLPSSSSRTSEPSALVIDGRRAGQPLPEGPVIHDADTLTFSEFVDAYRDLLRAPAQRR